MARTKLFMACTLAFAVSLAGTSAAAQEPVNQLTYFTFSAPFELPGGKTLPAGKYTFKILDSPSNRHIIHVMSEDQTEMHATLMAIPAQRMEPAEEPEVRFMEAEADTPPAIRTWWYPGRSIGHEFIYPKDHARRLAARQTEGVLTVADDAATEEQMRTAELTRIDRQGREAAVGAEMEADRSAAARTSEQATPETSTAERTTPEPTMPERTTTAAPTTTEEPDPAAARTGETARSADRTVADDTERRTELPRTASPMPLFALLGLGSLVGAGVLRLRRR
jgi:LPXTG-motif cell wall-anchored protein